MLIHPDYLEAIKTMPRDRHGCVVDLHYVPPADVPRLEAEWRKWCAANDRKVWPPWIAKWAETKKRRQR